MRLLLTLLAGKQVLQEFPVQRPGPRDMGLMGLEPPAAQQSAEVGAAGRKMFPLKHFAKNVGSGRQLRRQFCRRVRGNTRSIELDLQF